MDSSPAITPQEHAFAIRSLLSDPTNQEHAARIIDYARRDAPAAHAAHERIESHRGRRRGEGQFELNNLRMAQPAGVYRPWTVDELATLLQKAADEGIPVKPIGAAFALSDLDATSGYLLDLSAHLQRVSPARTSELREGAGTETLYEVEGGATVDQVNARLWADGFALYNQPGYGGLSLVGVASVGGHGSGQKLRGIAEYIRSIRVLGFDPDGKVKRWQVEPTSGITDPGKYTQPEGFELLQDDGAFYSLVVGLGALGVICSVTLAVRAAYYLREDRDYLPWSAVQKRMSELRSAPPGSEVESFAVWLNPYPNPKTGEAMCVLSTYTVVPGGVSGMRGLGIVFGGSNLLADIIVWWVALSPKSLPLLMDAALKACEDHGVVMRCTEALSFGPPNHLHVIASACGIDHGDTDRAVERIVRFAAQMAKKHGCYVTSPVGLRFVAAGRAYMAPQYKRDTCMIEMPILAGTAQSELCLKDYLNQMIVDFDARPHWGQYFHLKPSQIEALYPEIKIFQETAKRLGAGGRLSNNRLMTLGLVHNSEGPGATRTSLLRGESVPRWPALVTRTTGRVVGLFIALVVGLTLWGLHGAAPYLRYLMPGYWGPGSDPSTRPSLIPGIAWDDELISFVFGALLCVAVPAAVIALWLREPLRNFGLAPPPRERMKEAGILMLVIIAVLALPFFWGAHSLQMRAVYPIFRGPLQAGDLVAYECAYLLFFVALDGVLRGVLLFGLIPKISSSLAIPVLAIGVETVVQAVWHSGKPPMEAGSAWLWGIVGGYVAYRSRSVWPVVLAHWLLNVLIDVTCLGLR
jgi:membrane protease YdiL (CAAX protease family)